MKGLFTGLLLAPLLAWAAGEPPILQPDVQAGKLPPVEKRLPLVPLVVKTDGRHGGTLNTLVGRSRDTRLLVVYGYARLVAYDQSFSFVPDILESFEVQEGRIFTFKLRKGHRWSDGHPFTAEDFRYWFEDVEGNPQLSPTGLPTALLPNGERPQFEVLDARTVRYSWSNPNPMFLSALAGPDPLYIYAPAHYLKQFHKKYAEKLTLDALVKQEGVRNWATLHTKYSAMYRNGNPDLPSLEPWILKTRLPADRIIFERNPYYYRVDGAGHQLPYIDRVVFTIASSRIIPAKTGAGRSEERRVGKECRL